MSTMDILKCYCVNLNNGRSFIGGVSIDTSNSLRFTQKTNKDAFQLHYPVEVFTHVDWQNRDEPEFKMHYVYLPDCEFGSMNDHKLFIRHDSVCASYYYDLQHDEILRNIYIENGAFKQF